MWRPFKKEVIALPSEGNRFERIVRYMPWFTDRVCINVMRGEIPLLHNHPWNFVSIILWGGYKETRVKDGVEVTEVHRPGSVLRRRFDEYHRLEPLKDVCVTLFFRSKEKQKATHFLINGKPVLDMKYWKRVGCSREAIVRGYEILTGKRFEH